MSIRAHDSTTTKKTSELGEQLCRELNLQDRRKIFNSVQKAFHQHVDQHFDLTVPSYQQKDNMQAFVEKIIGLFPGYFNNVHANEKERIMSLQAYVGSYLDQKMVESFGTIPMFQSAAVHPNPNPSPKTKAKAKAKAKTWTRRKRRLSPRARNAVLPPFVVHSPQSSSSPEPTVVPTDPIIDANTSFGVYSPEPSPFPEPAVSNEHTTVYSPEPSPFPGTRHPHRDFCENYCSPPVVHLVTALQRVGVLVQEHLIGMARWNDDILKNFLRDNGVARTPLEEQALMVGFSCVLSDASRPASAMSL
ncbi:hypothetical protein MVEN_01216100 [Mycena venus]|uniref:Uncharacterized protein n=1 Tax=Mycena venus TaxID=2733690 RepID=A0A8H7CY61_9AGAR|nr:hypothetical protein MVEN_01216100 [Mycena venus]